MFFVFFSPTQQMKNLRFGEMNCSRSKNKWKRQETCFLGSKPGAFARCTLSPTADNARSLGEAFICVCFCFSEFTFENGSSRFFWSSMLTVFGGGALQVCLRNVAQGWAPLLRCHGSCITVVSGTSSVLWLIRHKRCSISHATLFVLKRKQAWEATWSTVSFRFKRGWWIPSDIGVAVLRPCLFHEFKCGPSWTQQIWGGYFPSGDSKNFWSWIFHYPCCLSVCIPGIPEFLFLCVFHRYPWSVKGHFPGQWHWRVYRMGH